MQMDRPADGAVHIIDSTLREGEQAPGISLSDADRRTIISLLHGIGVEEIEVGIASPANTFLPRLIAEARMLTVRPCRLALWCRCREEDIHFAASCRPDVLSLSIPVSDLHIRERLRKDRRWILDRLGQSIRWATDLQIPHISVGLEDGSRADPEFLVQAAKTAQRYGAERVRIADTVGICSPGTISKLVLLLKHSLQIEIGVHCHNDFGMATANSIAAAESGARWLDATVLGLGERAGNCRLEEAAGYLSLATDKRKYRVEYLPRLCRFVARIAQKTIAENHPLIGREIFTCETGLHQHGLTINPSTYEPFDPQRVGGCRKLLFGKKTGMRAINLQLAGQGITLDDHQVGLLTGSVRTCGQPLSERQLVKFAAEKCRPRTKNTR